MEERFKQAMEAMEIAFYQMAELAENNMPDINPDANDEEWFTHDAAMKTFEHAFKTLTEDPQPKTLSEELLAFYEECPQDFADDLEALDKLNGCLGDERRRPMASLDDFFRDKPTGKLLGLGRYSRDEYGGPFDSSRYYFYIHDGAVSTDNRDYSNYLDRDCVENIIANARHLRLSDGAREIIDGSTPKEGLR